MSTQAGTVAFLTRYRSLLILLSIFLLACVLRMYHLGILPYGLHEDELMNGYVGRFILLNGKDLYGNTWPLLYFNNFGDFPPVIPMYLSGISTFIFGVSVFAVRFPIALAGSLAVFPMYFVAKKVFAKERYAFTSAFFLAILPWHIILSRATAENITATAVHLVSIYFLFEYVKRRKMRDLVLMIALLFAKYFLYSSFRVTVPLSTFAAIFLVHEKKWRVTFIAISIAFVLLTLGIGKTDWGAGRFKQTSIFYFNNTLSDRIAQFAREEGDDHTKDVKIFHNKPVVYAREFIRQYLSYFSPTFLFSDGGLPHRYLMEDNGVLYISFIGFLVIAVFVILLAKESPLLTLFTKNGKQFFAYLLTVLLISPIPAALTLDDVPNVHRAAMVGVMLVIPITFLFACMEKVAWKKVSIQGLALLCIAVEFTYFWHQYSAHMPYVQSTFRGDDRTSLAKYVIQNKAQFDKIYLPHDAKPLYYLFFANNFDASLAGRFKENISLDSVDNIIYIGDNCPSQTIQVQPTKDSLMVDRAECTSGKGLYQIGQVKRYDGSGSFKLLKLDATPHPTPFDVQISKRKGGGLKMRS